MLAYMTYTNCGVAELYCNLLRSPVIILYVYVYICNALVTSYDKKSSQHLDDVHRVFCGLKCLVVVPTEYLIEVCSSSILLCPIVFWSPEGGMHVSSVPWRSCL